MGTHQTNSKSSFPRLRDYWEQLSNCDLNKVGLRPMVLRSAPDDEGVFHVGGRVGAAQAPEKILTHLENMMLGIAPSWHDQYGALKAGKPLKKETILIKGETLDRGLQSGKTANLKQRQQQFLETLKRDLNAKRLPIVIGGGHDYGYPQVAAAAEYFGIARLGLINVDAHFDLRPISNDVLSSGSPYFKALEDGRIRGKNFVEFGLQEHCNDKSLFDYAKKNKVTSIFLSELTLDSKKRVKAFEKQLKRLSAKRAPVVVSFDMDALRLSDAPGVSAPQAEGFTSGEFFGMVRICAGIRSLASIGFFEVNPLVDESDRTSKLVAQAIHIFAQVRMGMYDTERR